MYKKRVEKLYCLGKLYIEERKDMKDGDNWEY